MNKSTKNTTLLCYVVLMIGFCHLQAADVGRRTTLQMKLIYSAASSERLKKRLLVYGYCRAYHTPQVISWVITHFFDANLLQYKNKLLPKDLSHQDLNSFDFTGCQFTHTNLTDSNLENTILTKTVCDYEATFLHNIKKSGRTLASWYQKRLCKDLRNIAEIYPKLNSDAEKAQLLHIASGLSRSPFYEKEEFYIQVQYWSCAFLILYRQHSLGQYLVFSGLHFFLTTDALSYCWQTNYPKEEITIDHPAAHDNFQQYINDFTNGLMVYNCQSEKKWGYCWYQSKITKNIEGLKKAYPKVDQKVIQLEMCQIAYNLSNSYQVQNFQLLFHFLQQQNRLIKVRKSVKTGVKNMIFYDSIFGTEYINY